MENTGKEKDEKEGVREEGEWKGARVQCNQGSNQGLQELQWDTD